MSTYFYLQQMTALHWAAFHGRPTHLEDLIARQADIFAQDIDGKTPMHWAAQVSGLYLCSQVDLVSHEDSDHFISGTWGLEAWFSRGDGKGKNRWEIDAGEDGEDAGYILIPTLTLCMLFSVEFGL